MEDDKPYIGTDDKATAWWRWFTRRSVILPIVALLIVALGTWVIVSVNSSTSPDGSHADDQATLEANLHAAKAMTNADGIVNLTTSLIEGKKKGMFKYDAADYSMLYLDRASAYLNLKKYQEAVEDYRQAAKIDDLSKIASLQGEAEARYMLGDRKELIPVYQELIKRISETDNPVRGNIMAQYESNIRALQEGRELDF